MRTFISLRILFASFIALGVTANANSQVLIALIFGDKLNSPNLEFGLSAGLSLTTINNLPEAKHRSALNLGLYFDIRIKDNWWFHPEVQVKTSRGAKSLAAYPTGNSDLDDVFSEADVERRIGGFYVPLLIKYRFNNGFSLEGGIEPALRTKAEDVFTYEIGKKESVQYNRDIGDDVPRLDFGLAAGIGWRPRKTYGVSIVARFTEGLVNLDKTNTEAAQTGRAFVISAHIPIGVKKAEKKRAEKASEENAQEPRE